MERVLASPPRWFATVWYLNQIACPLSPPPQVATKVHKTCSLMGDSPEPRFVNYLEVGFNEGEFLLVFGQSHEGEALLHTRLVTSPYHAREFWKLFGRSVEDFEKEHGSIRKETGEEVAPGSAMGIAARKGKRECQSSSEI